MSSSLPLLIALLSHYTLANSPPAAKWNDFCEAIKYDSHATYFPELLQRTVRADPEYSDENENMFEEEMLESGDTPVRRLLRQVAQNLSPAERARKCDVNEFRASVVLSSLIYAPTCYEICTRCFPRSEPLCMLRRPKLNFMKTCLCTYDAEAPISGAVFSYRHDKRVERLLKGR